MLKKIGEIKIDTLKDYKEETRKCLEKQGYILVLTYQTYGTSYYDIVEEVKE